MLVYQTCYMPFPYTLHPNKVFQEYAEAGFRVHSVCWNEDGYIISALMEKDTDTSVEK